MWNDDWASQAVCKQSAPGRAVRPRGRAAPRQARVWGVPVRAECLAEALDNQIEWGVWGGMTERERRAILRKRPNVTSWRTLLETAMSEHAGIAEAVEAELTPG